MGTYCASIPNGCAPLHWLSLEFKFYPIWSIFSQVAECDQ